MRKYKLNVILILIIFTSPSYSQKEPDNKLLYEKALEHFIYGDLGYAPIVVKIKNIQSGKVQEVLCPHLGFIMHTNFDKLTKKQIDQKIDSLTIRNPFTIEEEVFSMLTEPYRENDYFKYVNKIDSLGKECLYNLPVQKKTELSKTCYFKIGDKNDNWIFKYHYLFNKGFLIHSEHSYKGDKKFIERFF